MRALRWIYGPPDGTDETRCVVGPAKCDSLNVIGNPSSGVNEGFLTSGRGFIWQRWVPRFRPPAVHSSALRSPHSLVSPRCRRAMSARHSLHHCTRAPAGKAIRDDLRLMGMASLNPSAGRYSADMIEPGVGTNACVRELLDLRNEHDGISGVGHAWWGVRGDGQNHDGEASELRSHDIGAGRELGTAQETHDALMLPILHPYLRGCTCIPSAVSSAF